MKNRTTMKRTLVVLANCNKDPFAKKFYDPIGPNGELLLEYTLFNAMESGFERIVMIANQGIRKLIKYPIESRFRGKIEIRWSDSKPQSAFSLKKRIPQQNFDEDTFSLWKAKKYLGDSFLVINAKHYYDKHSFDSAAHFLNTNKSDFGSISFPLSRTLSPYGGVDRAICFMKKNNLELKKIKPLEKIRKMNGAICYLNSKDSILSDEIPATHMYCLNKSIFTAYDGMNERIKKSSKMFKPKIGIPDLINFLVKRKMINVRVVVVDSKWFGTEFKPERILAKHTIEKMIARKVYPQNLGRPLTI